MSVKWPHTPASLAFTRLCITEIFSGHFSFATEITKKCSFIVFDIIISVSSSVIYYLFFTEALLMIHSVLIKKGY